MKVDSQLQSKIRSVREQLEAWRRSRKPGEHIPEILWEPITELARAHGVNRISDALRVGYYALQRRVRGNKPAKPAAAGSHFVELKVPPPGSSAECIIELERPSGAKMTVRLARGADALNLIEAFWRKEG